MKKCPLCQSANLKKSHKVDNFQYLCCQSCLTLFLFPPPSRKKLRQYYREEFEYPAGLANEELTRRRARVILNNLKKLLPSGKKLLDIGSGCGYFLDETRQDNLEPLGIEPSKELCQYTQEKFNLDVIETNFESYIQDRDKKKKFDFITIIHTIEHVFEPQKMIDFAAEMLNKNGILFIETPNLDSHMFNILGKTYDFLDPPHHLWLFSKKSFHFLLSKIEGLKIKKISTYSYPEHFMGIIKRIIKRRVQTSRRSTIAQKSRVVSESNDAPWDKRIKILLFDKGVARIMYPLLNLFDKGSILEVYIKKISRNEKIEV